MKRYRQFITLFLLPAIEVLGIIAYLILLYGFHNWFFADAVIVVAILFGCIDQVRDAIVALIHRQFALDYIALLAITTGLISGEFLVAAVIVLMLAGGEALEKYAVSRAKKSLTALTSRIPDSVLLWKDNDIGKKVKISEVAVGEQIFVRKGEVIPLDGILVSEDGMADESSLTGEPYEMEKLLGDQIRSGTINIRRPMIVRVTQSDKDSTYRKIIDMVRQAQEAQSPLVRIADRYSSIFTLVTLLLAGAAYLVSGNIHHVLAVLVIATPCPLILATPIALIGGMNALARRKVIVKTLSSIETLSRVTDIMFDKTGTITLGKPQVSGVIIKNKKYTENQILAMSEAIERNSLHPFAKAIVMEARSRTVKHLVARGVSEKIGYGILGTIDNHHYVLSKVKESVGYGIELREGRRRIAVIQFEDRIKPESRKILSQLHAWGLHLSIFTGDKKETAQEVVKSLGLDIDIKTECTPQDKMNGIKHLRQLGRVTAMVGDGINDAPALASADVGMVFSNEEQTAASEAADLVFLGGSFSVVLESLTIARRTIAIALQSIWVGIGLSIIGMILAALGMIPPLLGAFIQEAIDVSVIFNALRASR
ncbi:MAG TPA: heavy metal translocating P-type ATPase [Patescibacteria group bacterium]|nr:heavy metal translocating P-type ATPase [Patescibacteria group bacterium]